jgi:hypothetical protein
MGKVKQELLSEVGCLLCDTLYDGARADRGFSTCFECGAMLAKFARTERARFYDINQLVMHGITPQRRNSMNKIEELRKLAKVTGQ